MKTEWNHGPAEPWEKQVTAILAIFFIAVVAVSTVLHHMYPEIMRVPGVIPPRLMPEVSRLWESAIGDLMSLCVACIALYHGYRKYGPGRTALFFFGSMIFSGLEENEWILLSGRILGHKTYFFTGGGLWFLEIPVYTCLGWYVISYGCYEMFEVIGERWHRAARAVAAGLLAMSLDLFCDPLLVNIGMSLTPPAPYGLWVWENENTLRLFSIPIMNFIGWALLVSLFCYVFGYVSDRIQAGVHSARSSIIIFFGAFPIMLLICLVSLSLLDWGFQSLWGAVNIFPIDFPSNQINRQGGPDMVLPSKKIRFIALFALVPLWSFMCNMFRMYGRLRERYPDSPVIIIGLAVAVLLLALTIIYARRIFTRE